MISKIFYDDNYGKTIERKNIMKGVIQNKRCKINCGMQVMVLHKKEKSRSGKSLP